jgi:hypothetical protein
MSMEQPMKIADMTPEQKATRREYNRLRKQKQRDKERIALAIKMQDYVNKEHFRKMNEEGRRHRLELGRCFFGEVSPGVDARRVEDALQVAREFARALDQSDIQQTESLYDFELRIGRVWAERGGPFLNRTTQQLSRGWGEGTHGQGYWLPFEEKYTSLPGSKKPIDVTSLSPLPPVPEPHQPPAPIEAPETTPSDEEIREYGRVQLLRQLGSDPSIPQDARRYLDGL